MNLIYIFLLVNLSFFGLCFVSECIKDVNSTNLANNFKNNKSQINEVIECNVNQLLKQKNVINDEQKTGQRRFKRSGRRGWKPSSGRGWSPRSELTGGRSAQNRMDSLRTNLQRRNRPFENRNQYNPMEFDRQLRLGANAPSAPPIADALRTQMASSAGRPILQQQPSSSLWRTFSQELRHKAGQVHLNWQRRLNSGQLHRPADIDFRDVRLRQINQRRKIQRAVSAKHRPIPQAPPTPSQMQLLGQGFPLPPPYVDQRSLRQQVQQGAESFTKERQRIFYGPPPGTSFGLEEQYSDYSDDEGASTSSRSFGRRKRRSINEFMTNAKLRK